MACLGRQQVPDSTPRGSWLPGEGGNHPAKSIGKGWEQDGQLDIYIYIIDKYERYKYHDNNNIL